MKKDATIFIFFKKYLNNCFGNIGVVLRNIFVCLQYNSAAAVMAAANVTVALVVG